MNEQQRRRRRVRLVDEPTVDATAVSTQTSPVVDDATGWVAAGDSEAIPNERGLRGLIGGGSSQVGPTAALRARDAARPRPHDIARAEAELTVVRRNWTPRD